MSELTCCLWRGCDSDIDDDSDEGKRSAVKPELGTSSQETEIGDEESPPPPQDANSSNNDSADDEPPRFTYALSEVSISQNQENEQTSIDSAFGLTKYK